MLEIQNFIVFFQKIHSFLRSNYRKSFLFFLIIEGTTATIQSLSQWHPELPEQLLENLEHFPLGVVFGLLTVVLISVFLIYVLNKESSQKIHRRLRRSIRMKYIDYILLCLSTQLRDVTERFLGVYCVEGGGPTTTTSIPEQLGAMQAEVQSCIELFRERARKLFDGPETRGFVTTQELEEYFRIEENGSQGQHSEGRESFGEEILSLKMNSKPLLSEKAFRELLTR
ncbi:uncharacterized protein LOC129743842 [Uranotaenia lowii]|uniref:uncharacterized protein LOC129743842 n=1 Tax=Uranotaenia lowii TaxID=190385 RepID=UPI00247B1233|nr:uncharacterized protein LOC129743842 [Uranotaenia lowii]